MKFCIYEFFARNKTIVSDLAILCRFVILIIFLINIQCTSAYTSWTPHAKLVASDGAADDEFGNYVAINGGTMVIGSRGDNSKAGSAYVFTWSGSEWAETAKLTASDGVAGNYFGYSVAITDDIIVVGAFYGNGAVAGSGSAYVFVKPGGGWVDMTQTAKLTASDGGGGDWFGWGVAISNDTIAVGAPQSDGNSNADGSAYVFVKPGGGWLDMTQTAKLAASDSVNLDWLGLGIAISNDTIVVGAPQSDGNSIADGSAYVFVKPGGGWVDMTQTAKLTPSDGGDGGDRFGGSVTINSDTIVIGSPQSDGNSIADGSAYVFVKPGGGWVDMTQTAKLTASDGGDGDWFGVSVAKSDDTITVGAGGDDDNGSDSGSIYVFTKPGGGWTDMTQTAKFSASDGVAGDFFGLSVAVNGNVIVTGAYHDDDNGVDSGAAYVFMQLPTVTTTEVSNLTGTTASCGGNVTSDGGNPVSDRGVCWNKVGSPSIFDSCISDGTGTGSFASSITGLDPGTLYYVRAYATNSTLGVGYGNEVSFTTCKFPWNLFLPATMKINYYSQ